MDSGESKIHLGTNTSFAKILWRKYQDSSKRIAKVQKWYSQSSTCLMSNRIASRQGILRARGTISIRHELTCNASVFSFYSCQFPRTLKCILIYGSRHQQVGVLNSKKQVWIMPNALSWDCLLNHHRCNFVEEFLRGRSRIFLHCNQHGSGYLLTLSLCASRLTREGSTWRKV